MMPDFLLTMYYGIIQSNIAAEFLAPVLYIRLFPGLNLGLVTCYTYGGVMVFSSVFPEKFLVSALK
jgi:hypothetical protein